MAVAALAGLAISSYLFYVYVTGGPILCGIEGYHGCDVVRASKWAYMGPIPRPALGIVFYTAFLGLILASATAINKNYQEFIGRSIVIFATLGAGESLYLVGVQMFVIHAYCLWCLGSAFSSFVILGAVLLTKRK